jgi:hypothetical protein
VIDLDADGAGVNGTGLAGVLAFFFKFGRIAGTEKAKGVEVAFEVSPLAVGAENAFALGVGAVVGGVVEYGDRSLGCWGSHMSAGTRIKDAGVSVGDSASEKLSPQGALRITGGVLKFAR